MLVGVVLHPHDIHGRNVMMHEGRGFVVDVSDFLHEETCSKWNNLKKAYYWLYRPFFSPIKLGIPYFLLDIVRRSYRRCASFKTTCCRLSTFIYIAISIERRSLLATGIERLPLPHLSTSAIAKIWSPRILFLLSYTEQ
jgi:hypothetical protein